MKTWPECRLTSYGLPMQSANNAISMIHTYARLYAGFALMPYAAPSFKERVFLYVEQARSFLADYTLACCLGEARHTQSYGCIGTNWVLMKKYGFLFEYSCKDRGPAAYSLWNELLERMTAIELFQWLEDLFNCGHWASGYGGFSWGFIA